MKKTALSRALAAARWAVNAALELSALFVIYRTGRSVGDAVCITARVSAHHRADGLRFVIFSHFPEVFRGHPGVLLHVSLGRVPARLRSATTGLLGRLRGQRVQSFGVEPPEGLTIERHIREHLPRLPLALLHSLHFPLPFPPGIPRPDIRLSDAERRVFAARHAALGSFAVIHSQGKTTYTPNKEWGAARFQEVVARLSSVRFVQVGGEGDAPLAGAVDLRGKTASLRELVWLIGAARFVVTLEGVYNHIAAARGTPSFVIASGFTYPGLASYPTTTVITDEDKVACSPCWLLAPCPVPGRPCIDGIGPGRVVRAITTRFPDLRPA